jgi:hypothetical protein
MSLYGRGPNLAVSGTASRKLFPSVIHKLAILDSVELREQEGDDDRSNQP